jgi:putative ABC transport system permease protein
MNVLIKQILKDMWQYKLRSLLALFGIFWGTLTVILLLALGQGFHQASKENMLKLVDGTFFIIFKTTTKSYKGFPQGQKVRVKAVDIIDMAQAIPSIKAYSPALDNQSAPVSYRSQEVKRRVIGVSQDFAYLRKINLTAKSRFLNSRDIRDRKRIVIIGHQLMQRLFRREDAIGKQIYINQVPFKVIGVVQESSENEYNWYKNAAIIPYTAYISLWGNQDLFYSIILPDPKASPETAETNIRDYFAYRFHVNPEDKSALTVFDTTKIFQYFMWFFVGIQVFLSLCGALTLGVGCLGVTNIMYLIVTERTREIGLRIAIGARDFHILLQILLEALIITAMGGFFGFVAAYLIIYIMHFFTLPDWLGQPAISGSVVIITISILVVLGLFAGYFPARRASKMDPVEALTY